MILLTTYEFRNLSINQIVMKNSSFDEFITLQKN